MYDQWVAILVGGGVMIALRVVDFFLPKGWVSIWTKKHAVKDDDDESEGEG